MRVPQTVDNRVRLTPLPPAGTCVYARDGHPGDLHYIESPASSQQRQRANNARRRWRIARTLRGLPADSGATIRLPLGRAHFFTI